MSEEVTQSLRITTFDAWTVTDPEMFFSSTTAPLLVTVIDPDGASCEQLAPVVVASGNPHACGLATQSVPRVTGPLAVSADGAWAGACGWAVECVCRLWKRKRENPAVVLLTGPAPACWLDWALARWGWNPLALSMAAGRSGPPSKCGAVSPAATIRARPATVTAAHAGLRSADVIGDSLRCRIGVLVRAGDRDGLRCRADTRDTYGPSIRRGFALAGHPDTGPGLSCDQWRADAARVKATGSPAGVVVVTHAGCCG